jgi:hypothetical protein
VEKLMISASFPNSVQILLFILILLPGAAGQSQTTAQDRKLRRKYEDDVAHLFETLRTKAELPRLARISSRESLEELVCSTASLNAPVWRENRPAALMYRTSNPGASSEELERVARFKDPFEGFKGHAGFARYSVAVWMSPNQESGQPVWWVGIELYESAWWEFVDNTFTDDRPFRDDWRKLVTPSCRGID